MNDVRRLMGLLACVSRDIVHAPLQWRVRQWAIVLSIAVATLVAYVEKRTLQSLIQRDGHAAHLLGLFGDAAGDGGVVTLLGFAAFAVGRFTRKPALVDAAMVLGVAGLWCLVLTKTGQWVLAERRPNAGGAMRFFAPGGHGVSGHASAAALVYWPVRDVLARAASGPVRRTVGVGLLAWAGFIGWSRVSLGMHFVWNVILGLAIGFFTGFIGSRALRARDRFRHLA